MKLLEVNRWRGHRAGAGFYTSPGLTEALAMPLLGSWLYALFSPPVVFMGRRFLYFHSGYVLTDSTGVVSHYHTVTFHSDSGFNWIHSCCVLLSHCNKTKFTRLPSVTTFLFCSRVCYTVVQCFKRDYSSKYLLHIHVRVRVVTSFSITNSVRQHPWTTNSVQIYKLVPLGQL